MIARKNYLDTLALLRDQHLIKVITGIRRCGKSTLLEALQQQLISQGIETKNIIYISFEQREHSNYSTWQEVYDKILSLIQGNQMHYIFLDEVQLIPNFEKLIDALFVKKDIDLYITGSNAYLLSSELATLLSGRYIAINLHPYSFSEYVSAFPD